MLTHLKIDRLDLRMYQSRQKTIQGRVGDLLLLDVSSYGKVSLQHDTAVLPAQTLKIS